MTNISYLCKQRGEVVEKGGTDVECRVWFLTINYTEIMWPTLGSPSEYLMTTTKKSHKSAEVKLSR